MAVGKSRKATPRPKKGVQRARTVGGRMEVGFIGIGNMGCPMAVNLLRRNRRVRLHVPVGRDPQANLKRLTSSGDVVFHERFDDLASAVEVCFTMLPMPSDVEGVVLGAAGLIGGLKKGSVLVDCSTSSADLASRIDERLRKVGCAGIDSPVSGSPVRAEAGTLSLMVGGARPVYNRVRPLLECLGTPTYMGPPGSGQITKSINQIIVALVMAAIGEGIILGRKAGIDLQAMLKAVGGGLAGTEVMRIKGPDMIRERFEPGAFLKYHLKDLDLALQTAEGLNLKLPFTSLAHEFMRKAVALGRDEIDHSGLMTVIETLNGIKVPTKYVGGTR
jgi:3-hydroxyisobutyrate dehydrogenase-like beta-hydroxyacid dehydrogenase